MTNNSCNCFCNKLVKFLRGKDFDERSLTSQEKFAETGLQIFDKLILGSLVWITLPYAFTINEVLKDPKMDKLDLAKLANSFLKPFESGSFLFCWLLVAVILFVISVVVRRRALDYFDRYDANKKLRK